MSINFIEEHTDFKSRNKRSVWIFKLEEDYSYQSQLTGYCFLGKWLRICTDGTIIVPKGYAWDGCTPKYSFLDLFVLGTPDGIIDIDTCKPKTYYASLIHDALYQYYRWHDIPRKDIDLLFLKMMQEHKFKLSKMYYFFVRILGCFFSGRKHPKRLEVKYYYNYSF